MVQRLKMFPALSSTAITFATSSSCLCQFHVSGKGSEEKMLVMIMRISCLRKNMNPIFAMWKYGGKFSFKFFLFSFFFFSH